VFLHEHHSVADDATRLSLDLLQRCVCARAHILLLFEDRNTELTGKEVSRWSLLAEQAEPCPAEGQAVDSRKRPAAPGLASGWRRPLLIDHE
jgi:hypothetical protein